VTDPATLPVTSVLGPAPAPGVYQQDVFPPPAPSLLTGVPLFLGYATGVPVLTDPPQVPPRTDPPPNAPRLITLYPQFEKQFGPPLPGGYLAAAVRGFFENGGLLCYVVRLDDDETSLAALRAGLAAVRDLDDADLVCAPDIMRSASLGAPPDLDEITALQAEVLADCQLAGGRFAILDAPLTVTEATVTGQRALLSGADGALYYPWLWAGDAAPAQGPGTSAGPQYLPPCGHVAGIYARSDQATGVHKSPANEVVEGVLDLPVSVADDELGRLCALGVNCLQPRPGRGIRVWGARTLSDDPAWSYVGGRRVFLTMSRWVERFMLDLVHEPNDVRLWVRIMRELTAYLDQLFQRGALMGSSAEQAFFVKCDSETNPPEVGAAGQVVTQVGLALAAPAEFVVARIVLGASGVLVQPGAPPAAPSSSGSSSASVTA